MMLKKFATKFHEFLSQRLFTLIFALGMGLAITVGGVTGMSKVLKIEDADRSLQEGYSLIAETESITLSVINPDGSLEYEQQCALLPGSVITKIKDYNLYDSVYQMNSAIPAKDGVEGKSEKHCKPGSFYAVADTDFMLGVLKRDKALERQMGKMKSIVEEHESLKSSNDE